MYINWKDIFVRNIESMKNRKHAEFNFKILHRILPCGQMVSRWDLNTPLECLVCGEIETMHVI